jgi:hypothetical protein
LIGNDFVVLLTDGAQSEQCGEASCQSADACTALLIDHEVGLAASPGSDIRTFAIGAPGSEGARTALSEIALKGGTAPPGCDPKQGNCHFDMTQQSDFSASLVRALGAIAGQAVSCELPVPAAEHGKLDPSLVNVVYSSGDASSAHVVPQAQGWQYNGDSTRIKLCGSICDDVRSNSKARADVILGCPVVGPS